MVKLVITLFLGLTVIGLAQAEIYLGRTSEGTLVLTNLPRTGQQYQQVFPEQGIAVAGKSSSAPQRLGGRPYTQQIEQAALIHELPPALLHAVIRHESNYDAAALSSRGAAGLMQLMPGTARELGVDDVWDPAANIEGGALYLKQLLQRFDQDLPLALAAYNAGPGAVLNSGRAIPPYAETQRYVPRVLGEYHRLLKLAP